MTWPWYASCTLPEVQFIDGLGYAVLAQFLFWEHWLYQRFPSQWHVFV